MYVVLFLMAGQNLRTNQIDIKMMKRIKQSRSETESMFTKIRMFNHRYQLQRWASNNTSVEDYHSLVVAPTQKTVSTTRSTNFEQYWSLKCFRSRRWTKHQKQRLFTNATTSATVAVFSIFCLNQISISISSKTWNEAIGNEQGYTKSKATSESNTNSSPSIDSTKAANLKKQQPSWIGLVDQMASLPSGGCISMHPTQIQNHMTTNTISTTVGNQQQQRLPLPARRKTAISMMNKKNHSTETCVYNKTEDDMSMKTTDLASIAFSDSIECVKETSPSADVTSPVYENKSSLTSFGRYLTGWGNSGKDNAKEEQTQHYQQLQNNAMDDDIFPNLRRHSDQHSIIKQYLSPELYHELKNKRTKYGVTLNDIIRAGVALPYGNMSPMPNSSVGGIYVGDGECYTMYSKFLLPIIESYHSSFGAYRNIYRSSVSTTTSQTNVANQQQNHDFIQNEASDRQQLHEKVHEHKLHRKSLPRLSLQRHVTNLNPKQLIQKQLDPDGRYILYTRMRLARSLHNVPFPTAMNRTTRHQIEVLLQDCINDWQPHNQQDQNNNLNESTEKTSSTTTNSSTNYRSIMDMKNHQHEVLIRKHVLFANPDEFLTLAGFGNDWPDGRGVYSSTPYFWEDTTTADIPNVMIWCNAYDHFWIISNAKGGNVQEVFSRLSEAVYKLEQSLNERGHTFAENSNLGYLNSSPADIGTGLRASVFIKLIRLGRLPGFHEVLCKKLHLLARHQSEEDDTTSASGSSSNASSLSLSSSAPRITRYTGIFTLANVESLGKSEVELINVMITGVAKCIELEKRLENGETIDLYKIEL